MPLSKAFVDIIVDILKADSSIDLENFEILCNAIKEFLGRRTTEEFWKIIPDTHQATLLENLGLRNLRTNSTMKQIDSTSRQEITDCVKLSDEYIMDHFKSLNLGISESLHRFVRAIRIFQCTTTTPDNRYPTPWSLNPDIFGGPTYGMTRISRLQTDMKKLEDGSWALRLALVCFDHELQHQSAATLLGEESCTRKHKMVFYTEIAESINMSIKGLRKKRKSASKYTELLMQAGPGSLLAMADGLNYLWEESITLDEIEKIVDFIKEQLPECYRRIRSLDQMAAKIIISRLCAYGWTLPELRQTKSPLLLEIRKHIDFEKCEDSSFREMRNADETSVVHRNNKDAESKPEPTVKRRRGDVGDMISIVHQNNESVESEPKATAKQQKRDVMKRMACDNCHRRKRKCDSKQPCNSCLPAGFVCEYMRHLSDRRGTKASGHRLYKETLVVAREQKYPFNWNGEAVYKDVYNDSTNQGSSIGIITSIGTGSTDSSLHNSTSQTYSHLEAAVDQRIVLDHNFEPSSSTTQSSCFQNTRFWNEYNTTQESEGPQGYITNVATVPMIIQSQNNLCMSAMHFATPTIDPWMYTTQFDQPNQPEPLAELFDMPNSNP